MSKVIDAKTHGFLDYALAAMFLILPSVLNFSETAATVSYAVGVLYILASLTTKYPLGLMKLIPFPTHGLLESIMAAAWIAFPWIFGFAADDAARNFFIIAGVGLLVVALLTDYRSTYVGHHNQRPRERTV